MAEHQMLNEKRMGRKFYQILQNYQMILCFLIVLERIFLLKIVDDSGMGYLALPMDLFLIAYFGFALPGSKVISGLMKVYIRRNQYKNAGKVGSIGFLYSCCVAVFLCAVLFGVKRKISYFFLTDLSWIVISFACLAILFALISAGARSFLLGVSADLFAMIGYVIETVLMISMSFAGAKIGMEKGEQVSVLLYSGEIKFVYGAAGIMAGYAFCQLIMCLYWLVLYAISRHALVKGMREDQTRRTEETRNMLHRIGSNILPDTVLAIFAQVIILVAQWNFLRHIGEEETLEKSIAYWGCLYGKYLPFVMIPIFICCYAMVKQCKKIVSAYESEEARQLRDSVEKGLIKMNAISFSGAILIAILGQAFLDGLCGGMVTSVLKVINSVSVIVLLYAYYYVSHSILQRMQYSGESLLISAASMVVSLVATFIFFGKNGQNLVIPAVIICLYYGLAGILGIVRVFMRLKVKINWMKTFAYPAICTCISGLIVLLLNRGFGALIGNLPTLILGALIGIFVDVILLLSFRIINENQVAEIPFGFVVNYLARAIGII